MACEDETRKPSYCLFQGEPSLSAVKVKPVNQALKKTRAERDARRATRDSTRRNVVYHWRGLDTNQCISLSKNLNRFQATGITQPSKRDISKQKHTRLDRLTHIGHRSLSTRQVKHGLWTRAPPSQRLEATRLWSGVLVQNNRSFDLVGDGFC